LNRRGLLSKFLTHVVNPYVEDCKTSETFLTEVKKVYVKKINDIFARRVLTTRRQEAGESLQQFFQAFKLVSKDCSIRAVTAKQYREDLLRVSFIKSALSSIIR